MKQKIAKVIFFLSLGVYALILLYGIYSAMFGFDFFGTSYGWRGFIDSITLLGLILCIIPVLPLCLLYQILYLVFGKLNISKQAKKNTCIVVGSILGVGLVFLLCSMFESDIKEAIYRHDAKDMIKRAELSIPYSTGYIDSDGILGIEEFKVPHIFVDCDTNSVGFLSSYTFGEYTEAKLKPVDDQEELIRKLDEEYNAQAVIPLPDGNGTLYTYNNASENISAVTTVVVWHKSNDVLYYVMNTPSQNKDTFKAHTCLAFSEYSVCKESE